MIPGSYSANVPSFRKAYPVKLPLEKRKEKGLGCEKTQIWKNILASALARKREYMKSWVSSPKAVSASRFNWNASTGASITTLYRIQIVPLWGVLRLLSVGLSILTSSLLSTNFLDIYFAYWRVWHLHPSLPFHTSDCLPRDKWIISAAISHNDFLIFSTLLIFTFYIDASAFMAVWFFHEKFDIVITQVSISLWNLQHK